MNSQLSLGQLVDEIRHIYESDRSQAKPLIEAYLEKRLNRFAASERLMLLEKVAAEFGGAGLGASISANLDEEVLLRLFSLLLGRRVSQADLSSAELLKRLAESLNIVFDTLNQLVSVINATLMGRGIGEETIRHVIAFHLEGEGQAKSLETYLSQIKKAFLISQQAFKKAAHAKVSEILVELDPERIAADGAGGLKFGPLRKAKFFEIYEQRFRECHEWFESGRFMDDFLREFEKNAQKLCVQ